MIKRINFSGHDGLTVTDEKGYGYFIFNNPDKRGVPHVCVAEFNYTKGGKKYWKGTPLTAAQKAKGKQFKRLYVRNPFVPELVEALKMITEKDREEKKESDVIDDYFSRGRR